MKLADDKVVTVGGYKFEHARIVQGIMIYVLFLVFSIFDIAAGDIFGLFVIGIILAAYCFSLIVYSQKGKSRGFKRALMPAFFATICMPTSMI